MITLEKYIARATFHGERQKLTHILTYLKMGFGSAFVRGGGPTDANKKMDYLYNSTTSSIPGIVNKDMGVLYCAEITGEKKLRIWINKVRSTVFKPVNKTQRWWNSHIKKFDQIWSGSVNRDGLKYDHLMKPMEKASGKMEPKFYDAVVNLIQLLDELW